MKTTAVRPAHRYGGLSWSTFPARSPPAVELELVTVTVSPFTFLHLPAGLYPAHEGRARTWPMRAGLLMLELPPTGHNNGYSAAVGRAHDLIVPNRSPGLDDGRDSGLGGELDAVGKGEERI